MVVGSGHGDAPKYMGEGVVLHGTPGTLGILWPWFSYSMTIFRQFSVGVPWSTTSEACHLIFGCYIVKECCDIICDITVPHVHWSHDLLL